MRPGVTERKPSRASTCSEYTADHTEIYEEIGEWQVRKVREGREIPVSWLGGSNRFEQKQEVSHW